MSATLIGRTQEIRILQNALRLDGNEIITNTDQTLYLQHGNNGDLRVDVSTLVVDASTNYVGFGTTAPVYRVHLTSNSAAKPTSSLWATGSDARLKKDVRPYTDGLDLINKIDPVWFTYNGKAGMPNETGVGTLAQDFQKIAPYMVGEWQYIDSTNGEIEKYLDIDYGPLLFAFVNAIKEQQLMIDQNAKLKEDFDELQREMESLKMKLNELLKE